MATQAQLAKEAVKQLEAKISKYNYFPESYRDERREKRPIEKVMSERLPSRCLPDSSAKFLLVRTNDIQHPTDQHFAMQVLGTVANEQDANDIIETLVNLGYNQFPFRLLPLNVWRVFPPPPNSTSEHETTHQAILRHIINRDIDDFNVQEDLMNERLEEAREQKMPAGKVVEDTAEEKEKEKKDDADTIPENCVVHDIMDADKVSIVRVDPTQDAGKDVVASESELEPGSTPMPDPILPERSSKKRPDVKVLQTRAVAGLSEKDRKDVEANMRREADTMGAELVMHKFA